VTGFRDKIILTFLSGREIIFGGYRPLKALVNDDFCLSMSGSTLQTVIFETHTTVILTNSVSLPVQKLKYGWSTGWTWCQQHNVCNNMYSESTPFEFHTRNRLSWTAYYPFISSL